MGGFGSGLRGREGGFLDEQSGVRWVVFLLLG